MKKIITFFLAGVAIVALSACNDSGSQGQSDDPAGQEQSDDPTNQGQSDDPEVIGEPSATEPEPGEAIPGMEVKQATGTVLGKFQDHGFGAFLVQVDEGFPIGETLEYFDSPLDFTTLPEAGSYGNMIQVQLKLPFQIGNRISFSYREYKEEVDFESLFIRGSGTTTTAHIPPQVPICVITEYEISNN